MVGVRIVGIGVALPGTESVPGRIVKNQELVGELVAYRDALVRERRLHPPDEWPALPGEKAAEHEARWKALTTDDAWIRKMTGIYERCVADDCVATSDLATVAARSALTVAGLPVTAITHLRVGTVLPDYVTTPPTMTLFWVHARSSRAWTVSTQISSPCPWAVLHSRSATRCASTTPSRIRTRCTWKATR